MYTHVLDHWNKDSQDIVMWIIRGGEFIIIYGYFPRSRLK